MKNLAVAALAAALTLSVPAFADDAGKHADGARDDGWHERMQQMERRMDMMQMMMEQMNRRPETATPITSPMPMKQ